MAGAPELTTFGALVRYALELESAAADFYEGAGGPLGPVAGELAADHRERRRTVERARQQYLNEMILEPISSLDGGRYVVDASPPDASVAASRAILLEEASGRFYLDSATVARALLAEAARTFRRLAEGNARNAQRMRTIAKS